MIADSTATRQSIIDACLAMNHLGLNQGTSGNISVRAGSQMLITPSGVPYAQMSPDHIVALPIDAARTQNDGLNPSSEWQFHRAVLRARPDIHAVVHAHPTYATALAIGRQPIPPCHYMVAAFGGNDVPVTPYATFGSQALADYVATAMQDRQACLMANHGALVGGGSLDRALWLLEELEALARAYLLAKTADCVTLLTDDEMAAAHRAISGYGAAAEPSR